MWFRLIFTIRIAITRQSFRRILDRLAQLPWPAWKQIRHVLLMALIGYLLIILLTNEAIQPNTREVILLLLQILLSSSPLWN